MSKKIVGFMTAGVLVLVLGFVSTPSSAQLNLALVGGYYSPKFGEINDSFDEMNAEFDTDLGFKAGTMYGLALGYDLGPRFGLRLEYDSFESKTSDTWSSTEDLWEYRSGSNINLIVTPVILSLTYGFSPAYIGAGIGSFATKVKGTWTYEEYYDGSLIYSDSGTGSESDSPTGFILLAGLRFGGGSPFLNLEARYIVGTKAKFGEDAEPEDIVEADLSGLQLSLLGGFKFK